MSTLSNVVPLPTDTVVAKGDHAVTTSLTVAEVFGRQHKDVLKAIRNLNCSDEFSRRNFAPLDYLNKSGESQPMVEMTRDGFTFLVMGFHGPKASGFKEGYIAAFNAMEADLRALALEQALAPAPGSADLVAARAEAERLRDETGALKDSLIALLDDKLAAAAAAQSRPARSAPTPLTPAEHAQIRELLAAGLAPRAIAKRLGRSPATVSMLARGMALGRATATAGGAA